MSKEKFFSASPIAFLPVFKVKAILDYEADVSKKIIKKQIDNNVFNICRNGQKRRTVIWMMNNTFYMTSVNVDTIYERCLEGGRDFIKVGRGFYLPIDIIEGVFPFDSTLTAKIRRESELLRSRFNFVRAPKCNLKKNTSVKNIDCEDGFQDELRTNFKDDCLVLKQKNKSKTGMKRNSTIILTSGENISTVYTPEVVVARMCKAQSSD